MDHSRGGRIAGDRLGDWAQVHRGIHQAAGQRADGRGDRGQHVLLSVAAQSLPIGTAYAVWVGIGAAGTAILGVALLGEPLTAGRIAFLTLLVVAIIGLKWTAGE